jgi:hypothetical protein
MRIHHDSSRVASMTSGWRFKGAMTLGLLLILCTIIPWSWAEEVGVTDKTIRIGATIPLEGDYKVYGLAMQRGNDSRAGWPNGAEALHRIGCDQRFL